jgi:hypothetical protein
MPLHRLGVGAGDTHERATVALPNRGYVRESLVELPLHLGLVPSLDFVLG